MDPLSLLREWTIAKRVPRVEKGMVYFGDISYRLDEPTAFRATRVSGSKYYKVSEVLFVIQHLDLNFSDYLKTISNQQVKEFVNRGDYGEMVEYLLGRKATSEKVDTAKLLQRNTSVLGKRAAPHGALGQLGRGGLADADLLGGVAAISDFSGISSQSLLTQLLTKKHARQASVVQEHGANGDPLVYANDKELVQRDREAVKAVSALEKVQEERNRGLLAPNTSFKMVTDLAEALLKRSRDGQAGNSRPGQGSSGADGRRRMQPGDRHGGGSVGGGAGQAALARPASDPIIIVPNGALDLITMANAGEFLEKSHYLTPEERKKRPDAAKRLKELTITKVLGDRTVKFKVITNAMSLTHAEWDAVVAVFSNGKTWQFEEWRYKKPVELFSHCFGAMVHYDDEPVPPEAKGWNVKFYKINKTKRHLDGPAASAFWTQLEEWLRTHKAWVMQHSHHSHAAAPQPGRGGSGAPR